MVREQHVSLDKTTVVDCELVEGFRAISVQLLGKTFRFRDCDAFASLLNG